jgi:hypothetical protein
MKEKAKYGVYVEAPSKQTIEGGSDAIQRILESSAGDAVKIAAIQAISSSLSTTTSITNSSFNLGRD